ncbi:MAG TPA: signal peptidase II [Opitutales bacterium]|nr:signal peptidase II [Opitutales bacterium]
MTGPVQSLAPAPPRGPLVYARFWLTLAAVVAADQASKRWIVHYIPDNTYYNPPPVPVIDGFFYFVNISNTGAAWGLFAQHTLLLALLGIVALGAIFHYRRQLELGKPLLQYTFGMLCGGIIGNLLDRELHGRVVDFWDFHLTKNYRFPAFNVADSFITIGVAIYLLYSFRDLLPRRKKSAD